MNSTRLFHNYQYSLTDEDQSMIQVFLGTLPLEAIEKAVGGRKAYNLLHELTYAKHPLTPWSKEPLFLVQKSKDETGTYAVEADTSNKANRG